EDLARHVDLVDGLALVQSAEVDAGPDGAEAPRHERQPDHGRQLQTIRKNVVHVDPHVADVESKELSLPPRQPPRLAELARSTARTPVGPEERAALVVHGDPFELSVENVDAPSRIRTGIGDQSEHRAIFALELSDRPRDSRIPETNEAPFLRIPGFFPIGLYLF